MNFGILPCRDRHLTTAVQVCLLEFTWSVPPEDNYTRLDPALETCFEEMSYQRKHAQSCSLL